MQTTSHILMIRPVNFAFNAQTAVNNAFQVKGASEKVQAAAEQEFDELVQLLRTNGVEVTVINDTPEPHTPDSIFPNNWISFHENGTVVLYPMFADNRRHERKPEVIQQLDKQFRIAKMIDYTVYERLNQFLEGTGSLVLDRDNRIAYACLSPRTSHGLVDEFCKEMNYEAVVFTATDESGTFIYHTNVMMCIADTYAVICLQSIPSNDERNFVADRIRHTGKEIIDISLAQMNQFAGNMLQVKNAAGERLLVMSSQAYHSLTAQQIQALTRHNRIIHSPLTTIESNGGGSARCMMAEVFLQHK